MSYKFHEAVLRDKIMKSFRIIMNHTHNSQANPRLSNVHQEAVLGPSPGCLYLLDS